VVLDFLQNNSNLDSLKRLLLSIIMLLKFPWDLIILQLSQLRDNCIHLVMERMELLVIVGSQIPMNLLKSLIFKNKKSQMCNVENNSPLLELMMEIFGAGDSEGINGLYKLPLWVSVISDPTILLN